MPKHLTRLKGQDTELTEKELDDFLLNDQELPKKMVPTKSDMYLNKNQKPLLQNSSHPNLLSINKPRISVDKTWIN